MKRKRKNDQSFDWAASVANVCLVLAVVFVLPGPVACMAIMQQAIAGFTMTYLWPIVAFLCFLALLASDLRGQVLKARATWTSMLALVIVSVGSFVTVAMRY